ncbi:MAG: hypothetical protein L0216_13615, partial [Planctomycetales bacterium]|nr:hypothetical protein [Planctomycetales bacterium]
GEKVNAGGTGDLVPEQQRDVERMLAEAPGDAWVLAGHHPLESWHGHAREWLGELRGRYRIPLVLSAHTHHAHYVAHEDAGGPGLEMNLGSHTDWPPEWRVIQLGTAKGRLGAQVRRRMLSETVASFGRSGDHWRVSRRAADAYLAYREGLKTSTEARQEHLLDQMLRTHLRLLDTWPTALLSSGRPGRGFAWPADPEEPARRLLSDAEVREKILELLSSPDGPAVRKKSRFLADLDRLDRSRTPDDRASLARPAGILAWKLFQAYEAAHAEESEHCQEAPYSVWIGFPPR